MKNKSISITLACAIGSGLGTILSIEFDTFWIIGLFIGGIAGYLAYDIREVIEKVPQAFLYARKNINRISAPHVTKISLIVLEIIVIPTLIVLPSWLCVIAGWGNDWIPSLFSFVGTMTNLLFTLGSFGVVTEKDFTPKALGIEKI